MNIVQKILMIMGLAYIAIGGVITIVFAGSGQAGLFIMIPLFFVVLGIVFVCGVLFAISKKKRISEFGKKYPAKIYGYVNDTSYMVNGSYPVNTKVRYFDETGVKREAIIPTIASHLKLYIWIEMFEFYSGIRSSELPGDTFLRSITSQTPGRQNFVKGINCWYSFIQQALN